MDVEAFRKFAKGFQFRGQPYYLQPDNLVISRAPGRLDVMGGIADYSGSRVLQMPIQEATFVAVQEQAADLLNIVSIGPDGVTRSVSLSMSDVASNMSYEQSRSYFDNVDEPWCAYVAGTLISLSLEKGIRLDRGYRILIRSDVPIGKGVSSSAAIEVASMSAFARHEGIDLADNDLARYCQKVENEIVGSACGIMDQMSVVLGRKNSLLSLRCQPDIVEGYVQLPDHVSVWGIDSGIQHSVSGAGYTGVRVAAFMGYTILESLGADLRGYLANISPDDYVSYSAKLPVEMSGEEFLIRYSAWHDSVTAVEPELVYPVRHATEHPISENARVVKFASLLNDGSDYALGRAGSLMFESHDGYSKCGLGSPGTDRLVQMVRELGTAEGLYGARISGGGSGGTVAVLGLSDAESVVERIVDQYAVECGCAPYLFKGSSDGYSVSD